MKRNKLLLSAIVAATLITGGVMYAADHIDTPAVTGQSTDITDVYVFQGQNTGNLVFVANTQGLLAPGSTAAAKFDENTVIEFNIDNTGDAIEDLVIQCKYDAASNSMQVYGPIMPSEKGTRSKLEGNITASVAVTAYGAGSPVVVTGVSGVTVFAGPRDDPFYFDLTQYSKVIAGTATGFLPKLPVGTPVGTAGFADDTFRGTNVLSLVVEVPKSLLGAQTSGTFTNKVNVWVETKKKI
ncbi:MAG: DUF4331 family protein [Ferruginibacter sp.]|nr:DUF4331 family protein [Chitinophagaceae bacterium]